MKERGLPEWKDAADSAAAATRSAKHAGRSAPARHSSLASSADQGRPAATGHAAAVSHVRDRWRGHQAPSGSQPSSAAAARPWLRPAPVPRSAHARARRSGPVTPFEQVRTRQGAVIGSGAAAAHRGGTRDTADSLPVAVSRDQRRALPTFVPSCRCSRAKSASASRS